ncbi:sugar porter family MFS transporter [Brevibacterium sp. UCMA 11754]|uniref:sugar porter family MFS transporter n=1 Tax=Brevibacterium sp. UCMA 11754 TaxID=2749198 RepID=UPI001F3CA71E|nr:sugar porter family MFS transporter [Brevibacterium sp. UCMA 11754]MCF2570693.1 sugar porter family MFS transporter [Brevibacterium sp. UCMA 11754]
MVANSTESPILKDSVLPAMPKTGVFRKRIGLISIVACFGGLLFGYDTGVINGALRPMSQELGLTAVSEGVVTSSLVFAAAVGAVTCGKICDMIGRRRTIIFLALLFFLGTMFVVFAPGVTVLVIGRILLGLAVGGASIVVPVYLSELAPHEIRGSISGRNEVAIVSGQLAAFVVNAIIGNVWGHIDGIWRVMFAICAIPAVCLFIGMLRMPESPRWLVEHDRHEEALAVLMTVRTEERARAELGAVEVVADASTGDKRVGYRKFVFNKWLIRIVLVGMGVAVCQQLTGINSIMYYGQIVLIESGFAADAALIANIAPGIVAVLGGLFALYMMDRVDRRTTFIIGLSLTTTFHLLIGLCSKYMAEDNPLRAWVILALIVGFVASMQSFLNVAVWVWLAEVFPLPMRGVGIGISQLFGWGMNGVIALVFPSLVAGVGISGVFFIFAIVGVLALIFVATQVPETRGISLEKMEEGIESGLAYNFRGWRKLRDGK